MLRIYSYSILIFMLMITAARRILWESIKKNGWGRGERPCSRNESLTTIVCISIIPVFRVIVLLVLFYCALQPKNAIIEQEPTNTQPADCYAAMDVASVLFAKGEEQGLRFTGTLLSYMLLAAQIYSLAIHGRALICEAFIGQMSSCPCPNSVYNDVGYLGAIDVFDFPAISAEHPILRDKEAIKVIEAVVGTVCNMGVLPFVAFIRHDIFAPMQLSQQYSNKEIPLKALIDTVEQLHTKEKLASMSVE